MSFLCWCPDMGHEDPEEDGDTVDAFDAPMAAERYVESHFSDWSYPRDCEVAVRDSEGHETRYRVDVESVPEFSATLIRETKP